MSRVCELVAGYKLHYMR